MKTLKKGLFNCLWFVLESIFFSFCRNESPPSLTALISKQIKASILWQEGRKQKLEPPAEDVHPETLWWTSKPCWSASSFVPFQPRLSRLGRPHKVVSLHLPTIKTIKALPETCLWQNSERVPTCEAVFLCADRTWTSSVALWKRMFTFSFVWFWGWKRRQL